jgi:hypothetical protein
LAVSPDTGAAVQTPAPDLPKRDAKTDHPATRRNADAAAGGARPVTETASARGEEMI